MESHPVFASGQARQGLTYAQYTEEMVRRAQADPTGLPEEEAEKIAYTQLNLHRSGRIMRTWRPSRELADALARIHRRQLWLAVTEPWCGDSAQCLPCLMVAGRA